MIYRSLFLLCNFDCLRREEEVNELTPDPVGTEEISVVLLAYLGLVLIWHIRFDDQLRLPMGERTLLS